ncbi:MAG: hypothetical protein RL077_1957 [Verrucomicrobiota bacterium]|jgi:hypothetical protein
MIPRAKITDGGWARLIAAARKADGGGAEFAPSGFATRVVALAWERPMQIGFLFERFALRAVGASCFLAALSVASNFTFSAAMSDDELGLPADAVSVVFDLAD